MFALGVFTIVSVTARTVMIGVSFSIPELGAWSAIEMGTGIMVICCPSLKWLYKSNQTARKMSVTVEDGRSRDTDALGRVETGSIGIVERSFVWRGRDRSDSKITISESIERIDTGGSVLSK